MSHFGRGQPDTARVLSGCDVVEPPDPFAHFPLVFEPLVNSLSRVDYNQSPLDVVRSPDSNPELTMDKGGVRSDSGHGSVQRRGAGRGNQ